MNLKIVRNSNKSIVFYQKLLYNCIYQTKNNMQELIELRVLSSCMFSTQKNKQYPYCQQVMDAVCRVFDVTENEIKGRSRVSKYLFPRHIFIHICRSLGGMTYTSIGVILNRDHTTIIHANNSGVPSILFNDAVRKKRDEVLCLLNQTKQK